MSGVRPTGQVVWTSTSDALPDDDITVLIALADGEVWTGFVDRDGRWRFVSGDLVGEFDAQDGTDISVVFWSHFPEPPIDKNHEAQRREHAGR